MIGLIGKKIGMSQIYGDNGVLFPATVLEVGPCPVVQVKSTGTKDGYNAVKLGFGETKNLTKPLQGVFDKSGVLLETEIKIVGEAK